MSNLLLISLGWLFFGTLHSVLNYLPVRENLQEIFETDAQTYRLFYGLFSVVGFFFLAILTLFLDGSWVFNPDFISFTGGAILIIGSLYLVRLSFKNYSLMVFVGLQPEGNSGLKFTGLNRFVRHPLYLSIILLLVGFMVFWPSDNFIAACLILIGFTLFGARLEEQKLIAQHGKSYTDYMKEVPALFPRLK